MKIALTAATGFLAILGIAASIEHFFDEEHYNPGFAEFPLITGLHVALGGVYLGLALLQFTGRMRARRPGLHRTLGRFAVLAGITSGCAAIVVSALFPYSGRGETILTTPFAVLFAFSLGRGLWLARQGRFAEHREWMIRALAVATSIATQRLIFVPSLILLGASEETARWLSLTAFGIAFAIHCTVAELWIRATRPDQSAPEADAWAHAPRSGG